MKKLWSWLMGLIYKWRRRRTDRQGWELEKMEPTKAQLQLKRDTFTDKSTIGALTIEGQFNCYILEDPVRETKIPKITAIPAGTYEIVISYSNRFKKYLPLLMNVPNYRGVRIHPGNRPEDTEGCLLPGVERGADIVTYSRKAFNELFDALRTMVKHEKVFIEIINDREPV